MKLAALFLFSIAIARAEISGLQFGPLSNAATMEFVVNSDVDCTYDVVRKTDGSLVPFLDPKNFPGANSLPAGSPIRRAMIGGMGLRVSNQNGKIFSTTLEPMTDYLVPLSCGAFSKVGQFSTSNRPLGLTWSPRTLPNPADPGGWLEATVDHSVKGPYSFNNPMTGFAEHRITKPGQLNANAHGFGPGMPRPAADWNTATLGGVLSNSDGGASATYVGTSQSKLFIPFKVDLAGSVTLDTIAVGINACSSIGDTISVALTYDAATPSRVARIGPTSAPASGSSCVAGASALTPAINELYDDWNNGGGFQGFVDMNPGSIDDFVSTITDCADTDGLGNRIRCTHDGARNFGGPASISATLITGAVGNTAINGYHRIQVVDSTHFDVLGVLSNGAQVGPAFASALNPNFGILVWASSNAQQTLMIDYASIVAYYDSRATAYYSGAADYCSKLKDRAGATKCMVLGAGLYAIWTEDTPAMPPYSMVPHRAGESVYLGQPYHVIGYNGNGTSWSNNDPDIFYGGLDYGAPNTFSQFVYSSSTSPRCGDSPSRGYDVEAPVKIGDYQTTLETCRNEILAAPTDSFRAWSDANRPDGLKVSLGWGHGAMAISGTIGTIPGPDYVVLTIGAPQDETLIYGVYDVANAKWVGSAFSYGSPTCRWCTQHASEPSPGSFAYNIGAKYPRHDNVGTGWPFSMKLTNPITTPGGSTQQIQVTSGNDGTGATVRNAQPFNTLLGNGDVRSYLMDLQPGDVFSINTPNFGTAVEYARVVSIDGYDPTTNVRTITVKRPIWPNTLGSPANSYSTAQPWAAGSVLEMTSSSVTDTDGFLNGVEGGELYLRRQLWNFRNDPWGLTRLNENFNTDSHEYRRGAFANGGDAGVDCGADTNMADDCPSAGNSFFPVRYSTFQGRLGLSNGNTIETHPSHAHAIQARTPLLRRAYFNLHPFIASGWNDYGPSNVLQPGTRTVYKVSSFGQDFDDQYRPLDPTLALPFAWAGGNSIRDVSGPGSVIDSTKPYTYCWVRLPGECRSGSNPGEVFVSIGSIVVPMCSGNYQLGFCLGQSAMHHGYVVQQVIRANREGIWGAGAPANSQTNGITLGPGWGRIVSDQGSTPGAIGPADGAIGTPDGNMVFHRMQSGRVDWFATKVPALPAKDIVQRDRFVPVEVRLNPPFSLGVGNAVVEFGYDSRLFCQGMDANGTWNGRSEICVAGSQDYTKIMFASENVQGVPCHAACLVVIPAIAQRPLFFRWKYRDGFNQVISTGEVLKLSVN